jgi:hypothetical protein
MGWLDRWREARAEAAVRRQLVAASRRGGAFVVEQNPPPEYPEPMQSLLPPAHDVALAVNLPDLLAECARADKLAGSHGGFVATARIRELLRGEGA